MPMIGPFRSLPCMLSSAVHCVHADVPEDRPTGFESTARARAKQAPFRSSNSSRSDRRTADPRRVQCGRWGGGIDGDGAVRFRRPPHLELIAAGVDRFPDDHRHEARDRYATFFLRDQCRGGRIVMPLGGSVKFNPDVAERRDPNRNRGQA